MCIQRNNMNFIYMNTFYILDIKLYFTKKIKYYIIYSYLYYISIKFCRKDSLSNIGVYFHGRRRDR